MIPTTTSARTFANCSIQLVAAKMFVTTIEVAASRIQPIAAVRQYCARKCPMKARVTGGVSPSRNQRSI